MIWDYIYVREKRKEKGQRTQTLMNIIRLMVFLSEALSAKLTAVLYDKRYIYIGIVEIHTINLGTWEDRALDYVLGYTCSNDFSAHTMQMLTTQWSFSKSGWNLPAWYEETAYRFNFRPAWVIVTGAVLVTKEAIPDSRQLSIKAIYNG